MKLRKLLSILLTLVTFIGIFTVCSVSASARATAVVIIRSEPSYGGKVSFDGSDWGSYIYKKIRIDEETVQIEAKADPAPQSGTVFDKWVVTRGQADIANPASVTTTFTMISSRYTYRSNIILCLYG
jgi:hypothetical protein